MGNLTSKNTIKVSHHDTVLIQLKTKSRDIKSFNRNLDGKISHQVKTIQELVAQGKTKQAVTALKYKKTLDNVREKSEGSLNNLKELINSIELAQLEVELFKSLEKGNLALKELQNEMPIDQVERLMDDIADGVAQQNEISNLLGTRIVEEDDEALLEELAALESSVLEELKESLPEAPKNDEVSKVKVPEQGSSEPAKDLEFPEIPTSIPKSEAEAEKPTAEALLSN